MSGVILTGGDGTQVASDDRLALATVRSPMHRQFCVNGMTGIISSPIQGTILFLARPAPMATVRTYIWKMSVTYLCYTSFGTPVQQRSLDLNRMFVLDGTAWPTTGVTMTAQGKLRGDVSMMRFVLPNTAAFATLAGYAYSNGGNPELSKQCTSLGSQFGNADWAWLGPGISGGASSTTNEPTGSAGGNSDIPLMILHNDEAIVMRAGGTWDATGTIQLGINMEWSEVDLAKEDYR